MQIKTVYLLFISLCLISFCIPLYGYTSPSDSADIFVQKSTPEVLDDFFLSKYLRFYDKKGNKEDDAGYFGELMTIDSSRFIYSDIDSLYKERLQQLNSAVHLSYNDKVKAHIDVYVNRRRKQVNVMLALSKYYFPIFEEALSSQGVPSELKYLAIIESALNPRALSPAGASGLWQFMYKTGLMYDLTINPRIDERKDVEKASYAAAQYLKDLYKMFGDWTLAIAAYNCGPGNVNKAIRKAQGRKDFWEIYSFLPRETRGYVPAYIGATYVMNYYKEHGFSLPEENLPLLTDTLMINQELCLKTVAQNLNLPIELVRDLNPQYKDDIIPANEAGFSIRLPVNFVTQFIENKDSILIYTAQSLSPEQAPLATAEAEFALASEEKPQAITVSYRIKSKETLSFIARKFQVSVKEIMEWNSLKTTVIHPNQVLQIHTQRSDIAQLNKTLPQESKKSISEKPVKAEADTYATTTKPRTDSKAQEKPLTSGLTGAPQITPRIKYPEESEKTEGKVVFYTIKKGDTLYGIARKFKGANINEIVSLNNLKNNGNTIYPNQVLKIKTN